MTDTVDLMVVGVDTDIPRAKLSEKLVDAFKQEAYMFEALLDGAYGESAPYAAQSDVAPGLAEQGKEQLESLGLQCAIVPTGQGVEVVSVPTPAAPAEASAPATDADGDIQPNVEFEAVDGSADSALAAFKTDEPVSNEPEEANSEANDDSAELGFDTDNIGDADSALASFKKQDAAEKTSTDNTESAVDFSDELDSVGVDSDEPSGLATAKRAKNDVAADDDAIHHDFSDQFEDVGSDELTTGLKEGQQAKPDFNAEADEVDFSEDASLIGIHETEETRPKDMEKLEEDEAVRNLNSFPKEGVSDIDFSDDLETLETGVSAKQPVDENEQDDSVQNDGAAAEESVESVESSKSDVPEALAGSNANDLQAELIDPAPAKKEAKAPVVVDDGGLSLSSDDSAPLTAPKEKAAPEAADDGGLSLSADSEAPLTAPKAKANPQAADDGGLTACEPASSNAASPEPTAPKEASSEASSSDATGESAAAVADCQPVEAPAAEVPAVEEPKAPAPAAAAPVDETPAQKPNVTDIPKPAPDTVSPAKEAAPAAGNAANESTAGSGLVLPGNSVVPNFTPEEELADTSASATDSLREELPVASYDEAPVEQPEPETEHADESAHAPIEQAKKSSAKGGGKKKLVAAVAGAAVLIGGGTFAFMNAGSLGSTNPSAESESMVFDTVKDASRSVEKMKVKVKVADLQPGADLESLSTGELLVNLSDTDNSNGILDLEPYFQESGNRARSGPRFGAAVPAASERMIGVNNRVAHPADQYFDQWSNREADLSLFLALLDNLIDKGDLDIAQQLSDRAKDKLFAVMSSQRLARAYSDVGRNAEVSSMMSLAGRDTFAIKAPEERVLAISDYAYTEQAIGLNEDAMDTFLKATILARSLGKPESRTVGLSSAAIYFQSAGRTKQAQELLGESLQAGMELPENTAARDLAIRYIALSEARMGLFNQALKHARTIVDPFATVSAFHGIALAIESTGDDNNARKVLNMAYRAGSLIDNEEERRQLLSKVVLASESE